MSRFSLIATGVLLATLTASSAWAALSLPPQIAGSTHEHDAHVHAGFLDVTLYGADPTGTKDSTTAIQAAINDARDYVMTTYVPPGTYLVSDTLLGTEDGSGSGGSFCYQIQGAYGAAISGELVAPQAPTLVGPPSGARAVLKLAAGSAGFGDPHNPKPVVHFVDEGPASQYVNSVVGAFDCLMYAVIRDVDVDLGSGNLGAVGVQFYSAQYSYMANVTVRAGDGYAGIQGAPATSDWVNLTVTGGQYGILIDNAGTSSVAGVTLSGQSVAGIRASGNGAVSFAGFQINETQGAPVSLAQFNGVPQLTAVSLVDGSIDHGAAGPAIANPDGIDLLVQNVFVRTPGPLVQSGDQAPPMGSGSGDLVVEYAYTDTAITGASYAPNTSYDLVDGVTGQKGLTVIHSSAGAPASDLVLRHLPGSLPWFTDTGVRDVTSFGADATGNVDSTSAIQQAIDASEGKGDEVYLPRGAYLVSGTLHLHPDTKLFGAPGSKSTLWASTWDPKGRYVPFIQTANTATGKTFVADVQIILPNDDADSLGYAQSYLSALDWQAGRSSVLYHAVVQLWPDWGVTQPSTAPRKAIHVEKNGGGRWYGLQETGGWDNARDSNPGFRFLFVDGTTEPLTLYGPNLEHAEGDDFVEISNASNVRIFETKTECRVTWAAIENSNNVLIDGVGGDWTPASVGILSTNSTNVEAALLGWYADEGSSSASYVSSTGGGYASGSVSYLDAVSVFQEGHFDESPFPHCGDGACDGAETASNCPADCTTATGPFDGGVAPDDGGRADASGDKPGTDASTTPSRAGATPPAVTNGRGCACRAVPQRKDGRRGLAWLCVAAGVLAVRLARRGGHAREQRPRIRRCLTAGARR